MTTNNTAVNYTPEMVAILKANAPIDYAKAQELATQLERGARSIIAKCKREGIEYISKPAPAKKKAAPTKTDMVAAIMAATGADNLDGLEKATGSALNNLLSSLA
jgi:methionine synthase II (cobalamin-independent)|tara:strand:- start:244 stop:558 length:315 start_codon:yes stop_codon:yes gene_type:complete